MSAPSTHFFGGSIAKIEAEAQQAAAKYGDVIEACPYPFGSPSAFVFCNAFKAAKTAAKAVTPSTVKATPCPK